MSDRAGFFADSKCASGFDCYPVSVPAGYNESSDESPGEKHREVGIEAGTIKQRVKRPL